MKHAQAEEHFAGAEAVTVAHRSGVYENLGKRVFDVAFALAIAPFVGAVVLILAAVVSASDGAWPFFGHTRIGRDGRAFRCWKIRTMVPDAEARLDAHLARDPAAAAEWRRFRKLTDDPRITRIGDFLRRTSLDELPQLWNVLWGEMSFVGPRPVMQDELDEHYGAARAAYHAARPGITGLWQVSGRNDLSYAERVELDAEYVRRMSFALDVWIILRTAGVVVRPTGR
jgi:lipopolysaccharide/colanic/teichoic acid biosynthesis glycosyltransferase